MKIYILQHPSYPSLVITKSEAIVKGMHEDVPDVIVLEADLTDEQPSILLNMEFNTNA